MASSEPKRVDRDSKTGAVKAISFRGPQTVVPMLYKDRIFLIWPGKSHLADAAQMCRYINSPDNTDHVYNEFLITEEEFLKGTGKPHPFKYYKEMNKLTGAEAEP